MYKKLKKSDVPFIKAGIKPRIINLLKEGEEEAQFSKMLATIRRDAPITFTLPEVHWKDTANGEAVLALFSELGFRTLGARIRALFAINGSDVVSQPRDVTDEAVARAAILLWLVESDRTNPTYDDIMDYGRSYLKVETLADVIEKLEVEIDRQELGRVYREIEVPLMRVIEYMNSMGVVLDTAYLTVLSERFHAELTKLEASIYAHAGTEFNINSPKQLGDILYDTLALKPKQQKKTATGQRSTRESSHNVSSNGYHDRSCWLARSKSSKYSYSYRGRARNA